MLASSEKVTPGWKSPELTTALIFGAGWATNAAEQANRAPIILVFKLLLCGIPILHLSDLFVTPR